MFVTKCGGLSKTNIIVKPTGQQLPFKGNENNASLPTEEKKSDAGFMAVTCLALAGLIIFGFRKQISKFLGLGGGITKDIQKALTDCTRFESSFIKNIEKRGKYNVKDAIVQVENTMLRTKEGKKGKGIIALLPPDVKQQCKISNTGIALGHITEGSNQPKFTKIISCKELIGLESFESMGNNGVIILP